MDIQQHEVILAADEMYEDVRGSSQWNEANPPPKGVEREGGEAGEGGKGD